MRVALVVVVALIVAACAVQQSSSERGFLLGNGARGAQAALDAEVILQGMNQARDIAQRVARDVNQTNPGTPLPPVTR